MLQSTKQTIKEEDKLSSFPNMAKTLNKGDESLICTDPKPLKSCLKTNNIDIEPEGYSKPPL